MFNLISSLKLPEPSGEGSSLINFTTIWKNQIIYVKIFFKNQIFLQNPCSLQFSKVRALFFHAFPSPAPKKPLYLETFSYNLFSHRHLVTRRRRPWMTKSKQKVPNPHFSRFWTSPGGPAHICKIWNFWNIQNIRDIISLVVNTRKIQTIAGNLHKPNFRNPMFLTKTFKLSILPNFYRVFHTAPVLKWHIELEYYCKYLC